MNILALIGLVPPQVWEYLAVSGLSLTAAGLHNRGVRTPVISAILDLFGSKAKAAPPAGGASPAAPDPLADRPILNRLRRLIGQAKDPAEIGRFLDLILDAQE